ncbi:MAG: tetratricopeptide repeat protein [Chloroflexi bacterium]|nr:tetratricopeptide repeat protein [Chloroflexota bacterium]
MPVVSHPLPMIGRRDLVVQVITRLRCPDDVRTRPVDFMQPGFYGEAGIGKSRLLREIALQAAPVTPYIVSIDFDPRSGAVPPGTPLELITYLIDRLEILERKARPFWQQPLWSQINPFTACRKMIAEIKPVPNIQHIEAVESTLTGITQQIESQDSVQPGLGQAFAFTLQNLCHKSKTQTKFGSVGGPASRPLILIILDTIELASRPVRAWLPKLPGFFSGGNTVYFHVVCVTAGRQQLPGLTETLLPPLEASEAATFVRTYVSYRQSLDWTDRWTGLPLLKGGPLLDGVLAVGEGIPLLLQMLADMAALVPQEFNALVAAMPAEREDRLRFVTEQYLLRLRAQAGEDDDLWQSYYLLLYSAIPRRLAGTGLLRALLQDLPYTPFHSTTNYDKLMQRLAGEAYVVRDPDNALRFHEMVREGVLAFLQRDDPERWQLLQQRAATWFQRQGNHVERLYHAVQGDYWQAMQELKQSITQALAAGDWGQAQSLIATTTYVPLAPEDNAWMALFKADLAHGEGHAALAMERLRRLYGQDIPTLIRDQVAARLDNWWGFKDQAAKWLQSPENQPEILSLTDILWWAEAGPFPELQADALLELGRLAFQQDRYGEAEKLQEQALALYRQIGASLGAANALHDLGRLALQQDRYGEAEKRLEQALALYRQIGASPGEANTLRELGQLASLQHRYRAAQSYLEEALQLFAAIDLPLEMLNLCTSRGLELLDLSAAHRARGEDAQAYAACDLARRLSHWVARYTDKIPDVDTTHNLQSAFAAFHSRLETDCQD